MKRRGLTGDESPATDWLATNLLTTDCRPDEGPQATGTTTSGHRKTGHGLTSLGVRRRTSGCAVEQGDAADEVRAGREPRPSQLIPRVGRATE
jgi:hypothetical protein